MKGSWAGAMGQSQFMPTSFRRFAEDYNGDGRRDIWSTQADVFLLLRRIISSVQAGVMISPGDAKYVCRNQVSPAPVRR